MTFVEQPSQNLSQRFAEETAPERKIDLPDPAERIETLRSQERDTTLDCQQPHHEPER
ncbi:hypothetical protein [Nisaea nitritireducens]|uniref:hypothetical protein n=1 Tax=Nisaea nitritireducens TaxID=568392 RepID=UPI001865DCB9|nr:hypothetical protein [Nisaea nitritireducens]